MRSSITVQRHQARTVVRLVGEIDASLRKEASRALAELLTRRTAVLVDLGQVRFIDSTGIAFLLQCQHACQEVGLELSLHDLPDQAARTLDTLGLLDYLPVEDRLRADELR